MYPESLNLHAALLPRSTGVGLKLQHARTLIEIEGGPAFIEIHAENFMGEGGPAHRLLERLVARYPLSVHGVGLSIGGEGALDQAHVSRLARLLARYPAVAFSEHLAWSTHGGAFFNDLLPIPFDNATLVRVCAHIQHVQERLMRPMLLENPATYVEFAASTWGEADFISETVRRTGCGLLLDVNNAYVSSVNHARDIDAYVEALPLAAVGEIHLAGFAEDRDAAGVRLLIDNHGAPVDAAVWSLYERVVSRIGACPTLIEWDNDVPDCPRLLAEAQRADAVLRRYAMAIVA